MPRTTQTSRSLADLPLDATTTLVAKGGLNPQPLPPRELWYAPAIYRYLSR